MKGRRSHFGAFRNRNLTHNEFNTLLQAGFNRVRDLSDKGIFRVVVSVYAHEKVQPGWYEVDFTDCSVSSIGEWESRERVQEIMVGQRGPLSASCTFFLCANLQNAQKMAPGERGLQQIYIAAGMVMNDAVLVATSLGLKTHISPAVRDSLLLSDIGYNSNDWQAIHTLTVG